VRDGLGLAHNAVMRRLSRIVDVLRVAAGGSRGVGIAWTEMARGLLAPRVRLDGVDAGRRARPLAAAFARCVEFSFEPLCAAAEPVHA